MHGLAPRFEQPGAVIPERAQDIPLIPAHFGPLQRGIKLRLETGGGMGKEVIQIVVDEAGAVQPICGLALQFRGLVRHRVPAPVEHQRRPAMILVVQHFAHEYQMIAAVMGETLAAQKMRGTAIQERCAATGFLERDAIELSAIRPARETSRQRHLVGSQHIDDEVIRSLEGRQAE